MICSEESGHNIRSKVNVGEGKVGVELLEV